MNKKTLISIFSSVVSFLPALTFAADDKSPESIAKAFATNLGKLAIPLATIGFIVVGIIYVSASANPSKMSVAKEGLVAVVIGVVILVLSATALTFVSGLFGL